MKPGTVVVDSSIWIDHIAGGHPVLADLLKHNRAAMHPMVYGEIAMGSFKARDALLRELRELPRSPALPHAEVSAMVEWLDLYNKGIGFIDAHLVASARMIERGTLLTRDKRLLAEAERLKIAYQS